MRTFSKTILHPKRCCIGRQIYEKDTGYCFRVASLFFGKAQFFLKNTSFEDIEMPNPPRLMYRDTISGVMKDTILSDITPTVSMQNVFDWKDCGSTSETPPDVHPTGKFGINWQAQQGKYYLGMVTRDNGTWESIGQKLQIPLKPDTCYKLTAWLMCSPIYKSFSRKTKEKANYNQPTRLRIWGSNNLCDSKELFVTSQPIVNRAWMSYSFVFQPKKKTKFLRFEAFYTEGASFYNGNLLIDNISDITLCSCSKLSN